MFCLPSGQRAWRKRPPTPWGSNCGSQPSLWKEVGERELCMICPLVRSVRKHETAPWGLPGIFFSTALPVHEEQLPLDTLAMGSERDPFLLLRE